MSADPMDLLERFAERRYVCLSEAEAAELGSGTLAEWREACRDGVHVDGQDYLGLRRDAARLRALADFGWVMAKVGAGAVCVAFWLTVASLVAGWWG